MRLYQKLWQNLEGLHQFVFYYPMQSSSHALSRLVETRKTVLTDTPQFRGGNPYFFSENPYTSVSFIYASIYRENVYAIHIAMQFAKKSRHCVIKIDQNRSFTSRGATVGLGIDLRL